MNHHHNNNNHSGHRGQGGHGPGRAGIGSSGAGGGPKLGVWHNPTADYGFGLGPWGSIAAVIALFAMLLAFVPPENKVRNVTTVAAVAGAAVLPFAVRDRWGRNLYSRAAAEAKWLWHRQTGANLWEHAWFSVSPVERSALPGLLSQMSVAEHDSPTVGRYAVVHHPPANTVSVIIQCQPPGDALTTIDTAEASRQRWGSWLAALADEPGLAAVQVVTEAAPTPHTTLEHLTAPYRHNHNHNHNGVSDTVLEELVESCAGTITTRVWVTVSWTDDKAARNAYNTNVLPARIERLCSELGEAGGGACRPLAKHELAAVWAGMYGPDRRDWLAANPDNELLIGDVGPATSVEERDRYSIGNWDTVSLTVGQAPDGEPTGTVHHRLAAGIDDTVAIRWAAHYRPVTSLESRAWAKSIQRAIETRMAMRGDRKQTAADLVADEDATSTAAALARGTSLTRVGFTITLTLAPGADPAGPIERARAAAAPLSPHLRVMDGVHQTSWVATLPGAMAIPETITATEWLNQ